MLEVLIGMALVGVVAASVGGLMTGAHLSTTVADHVTRTTAAASNRIEILTSLQFDAAGLRAGGSLASSEAGYAEDPWAEDDRIFVRWRIVDESGFMKRIEVVAGIRGASGTTMRESMLSTYRVRME